jgi:alpha-galactosidase
MPFTLLAVKLGKAAQRIAKEGDTELWARPLNGGVWALALFDRGTADAKIAVTWESPSRCTESA